MEPSLLILWTLASVLGLAALSRGRDRFVAGLRSAYDLVKMMIVRLPIALLFAGFLSALIPNHVIAGWTGADSGVAGVLVASAAGGFVPSGPFVSFPVALTLFQSGAGLAQVIAFVTAWSAFAFHRVIVWELPLVGFRFTMIRLASSLVIPPAVGILAAVLLALI